MIKLDLIAVFHEDSAKQGMEVNKYIIKSPSKAWSQMAPKNLRLATVKT